MFRFFPLLPPSWSIIGSSIGILFLIGLTSVIGVSPCLYTLLRDNSTGNIPRRRVYTQGDTPIIEVKPMEKRMPIEEPIILQEGGSKGKILNIAAHDPQRWNSVIDLWKGIVVADFIKKLYRDRC